MQVHVDVTNTWLEKERDGCGWQKQGEYWSRSLEKISWTERGSDVGYYLCLRKAGGKWVSLNERVSDRERETERGQEKAESCSEETGAIKKEHVFTVHINLGDVSSWICTRFSFLLDLLPCTPLSLDAGKPALVTAHCVVLGPLTPWLWQLVSAPC